jgi:hypothetical protein
VVVEVVVEVAVAADVGVVAHFEVAGVVEEGVVFKTMDHLNMS